MINFLKRLFIKDKQNFWDKSISDYNNSLKENNLSKDGKTLLSIIDKKNLSEINDSVQNKSHENKTTEASQRVLDRLNVFIEEKNKNLKDKNYGNDTETSVNILKALNEKHKKGVFNDTPQKDIDDVMRAL